MSFQEKKIYGSLFSNLLSFTLYYLYIWRWYQASAFTIGEELQFWGAVILILIPVQIVFQIVVQILLHILNSIVTGQAIPSLVDEFDKLVEAKSTRNFYHVFITGFVVAMGALACSLSAMVMFNILLFSLLAGALMMDFSQLYFYRKGI